MLSAARRFYDREISKYLAHKSKKPFLTQAREFWKLFYAYRFPPYQYITFGLYDRDLLGDAGAYLPPLMVDRYVKSINEKRGEIYVGDKALFQRTLAEHGLPVLRELFSFNRAGELRDPDNRPISQDAARAALEAFGKDVFVKPVFGQFGRDARVVTPAEYETLLAPPQADLIVQPRLRQHPAIAALHPSSVNTVRIDTLWTGERWVNNAAILRVGRGGSSVDNSAHGGFGVGIDLATGQLRDQARQRSQFGTERYERHPDTGIVFGDVSVPHWDLVRRTVATAADVLLPHGLRSLGWDVCVTENGVMLIEANAGWNVSLIQMGWGGLRDTELGRRTLRHYGLLKEER